MSADLVPLPHTGELVDLNSVEQVADALRQIREHISVVRRSETMLAEVLVSRSQRIGSKTMHVEGVGKVEVKGGKDITWDALGLKRDLLEAGMPPERVAEIVVETLDRKVNATEANKAARASDAYREIIERHRTEFPKRASVTVT